VRALFGEILDACGLGLSACCEMVEFCWSGNFRSKGIYCKNKNGTILSWFLMGGRMMDSTRGTHAAQRKVNSQCRGPLGGREFQL
jgi:hypothetical protein